MTLHLEPWVIVLLTIVIGTALLYAAVSAAVNTDGPSGCVFVILPIPIIIALAIWIGYSLQ